VYLRTIFEREKIEKEMKKAEEEKERREREQKRIEIEKEKERNINILNKEMRNYKKYLQSFKIKIILL